MGGRLTTNNHAVAPSFSPAINDALQECELSRSLFLAMSSETEVSTPTRSLVQRLRNIGLYINDAMRSSIRSIGHGGNMINSLNAMLTQEQREHLSHDLRGMQREMVTTYVACQAADNEMWHSIRQAVNEDPALCEDHLAIQCVDAIEEHRNRLQALPATVETLRERSSTLESIQSQLSLLEEQAERLSPNSPLKKLLQIFNKALEAFNHLLKGFIKCF
ncbi:unnamed protein product [Rotaria magnacalcarata]|uniref:Uncharacterized protein n=1 Tax=Rotaria magnacalcarata TaxID=392030 RepID=A0A815TM89_9BILA|nr:unnamed protein product [Rotaria magnacalcarata]CAF1514070.1 unnamed protein product [Rotaria magnacalcarata]